MIKNVFAAIGVAVVVVSIARGYAYYVLGKYAHEQETKAKPEPVAA
jgi:hypothetical protein